MEAKEKTRKQDSQSSVSEIETSVKEKYNKETKGLTNHMFKLTKSKTE